MDDKVKELSNRFAILLHDTIDKTIGKFMGTDEEIMAVSYELASNGYAELTFQPKITFSFTDNGEEGKSLETTGVGEKNGGSKIRFQFGGEKDIKFFKDMAIGSQEEIADMERAMQEVRNASSGDTASDGLAEAESEPEKDDADRSDEKIIESIVQLAKKMNNFFQRHIVAYSFNKIPAFSDLKDHEGNKLEFPKNSKIILYIFDDKAWEEKIVEIVGAIAQKEPGLRTDLLTRLETVLAHYSGF